MLIPWDLLLWHFARDDPHSQDFLALTKESDMDIVKREDMKYMSWVEGEHSTNTAEDTLPKIKPPL